MIDYTLYLVTDSTMLPEGTTLLSQVEAALKNGVTIVQLREKDTDTKTLIHKALELKQLCDRYEVPLIIDDRVDVAMAIDASGVHVGQSDMPIPMVRKLVGPEKIVGWSVGKVEEVDMIAQWGPEMVNYIGVGTVFDTQTKKDIKKIPFGPEGVSKILTRLEEKKCHWCRTVAIGGLHPDNIARTIYQAQSQTGSRSVDGICVVSEIMASKDAAEATKNLRNILKQERFNFLNTTSIESEEDHIKKEIQWTKKVKNISPLIHHITNRVHQNFGANVALAIGCSPIMSEVASEFADLSAIPNAVLLLNTGSVADIDTLTHAVKTYNAQKRPIVFDPVGFSASATRLNTNLKLLSAGQYSCIKGNAGEIMGIAGVGGKMKGVDSSGSYNLETLIEATQIVAFKYRTIAVCSGKVDIVVDGTVSLVSPLSKGLSVTPKKLPYTLIETTDIPLFDKITASGCSLGTVIAGYVSAAPENKLYDAVTAAVRLYKEAGTKANTTANGSGSFQVHLIDNLYKAVFDE